MEIRITRARKVFADGKHNAFTGIAAREDKVFIVFRSGENHVSPHGTIKVICSNDMEHWRTTAEIRRPDADLRDPKVIFFKGKLMVFCGERRAGKALRRSLMSESRDGGKFSEPLPVRGVPEGQWLWHVKQQGDKLYGSAYCKRDEEFYVSLYASVDGLTWEETGVFPVTGNEVYLDFNREGVLWALVRDDNRGCIPAICTAEPPYARFRSVTRLPMRLQGPMIKRLENGCVIACRQWDPPGRRNLRTDLFWLEDGREIRRVGTLPSGGDTSYAGWLDVSGGRALISYYSSHEHKMDEPHTADAAFVRDQAHAEHTTAADIFLADISYV